MENAYPGSNILVVTLTNEESKRVEAQSDEITLIEAMEVLRDMFGPDIPDAVDILVPHWWNNRFQRCSYSNYPIVPNINVQVVHDIKVCFQLNFQIYYACVAISFWTCSVKLISMLCIACFLFCPEVHVKTK